MNEIDLSRTDLNLLILYEAVMAEQNVGRAAKRLSLTPSAVSHGLGRLRRLLNDPLFLRTPKGVVATERAEELAAPIADILARVRAVVATADAFDPAASTRRFTIGAPDAILAVLAPCLLEDVGRSAPGVDIAMRHLLVGRTRVHEHAWEAMLPLLDSREIDLAILPVSEVPARFAARTLYREAFVAVFRRGHPFRDEPTLERFCALRHLLVSQSGDNFGFVDEALEKLGRTRRVAVTVPNFIMALAIVAESDLIAAVPDGLARHYGAQFGLETAPLPLPVWLGSVSLVVPKSAIMDAGIAWLYDAVHDSVERRRPPASARS